MTLSIKKRIAGTEAQKNAQQLRAIANYILTLRQTTNLTAEQRLQAVRNFVN